MQLAFADFVSDRWNEHLDELEGACVLRKPRLAQIVAQCLRHFDGDRYVLDDFVVMPNHVHLLVAFPSEESQLAQCDSWKHYTAVQINRALGRRGDFGRKTASTIWFAPRSSSSIFGGTSPTTRYAPVSDRASTIYYRAKRTD